MKSLVAALSLGACLATLSAATAATRTMIARPAGFGRALPAPGTVDRRLAPTRRTAAPALGRPARRPRLPVYSPVIGTGDLYGAGTAAADVRPEPPGDLPPAVLSGSYDITSFPVDPPDFAERYVDQNGIPILRTNPGPRIIYVSERQPTRRRARMPTIIHGVTLVTR